MLLLSSSKSQSCSSGLWLEFFSWLALSEVATPTRKELLVCSTNSRSLPFTKATSEWNVYLDPEATAIVLSTSPIVKIRFFTLELAGPASFPCRLFDSKQPLHTALKAILLIFARHMRLPLGATPIFDLPPIVAAIRPDLFTYRPVCLSINTDTQSDHYGRTSVDLLGVPNAEICMTIDVSHSSYKLLLLHVLRALGKNTVRRDVEALSLCITRSISTYTTTKLIQDFFVNKHDLQI